MPSRSLEQKRREDLTRIISVKQALLDGRVAQLSGKKRAILEKRDQLRTVQTIGGTDDAIKSLGDGGFELLARSQSIARRDLIKLDQEQAQLDAEIRNTVSENVSLEIAKRKIRSG